MRWPIFCLIVISAICFGCDRGLHFYESDDLGTSSQGTVVVETWFTGAPLEGEKWKICLRQNDSTNTVVLLTVESVFQESEPGSPRLVITNGIEVIQDVAQSYVYSLTSRHFITNVWTNEVYAGDYRPKK